MKNLYLFLIFSLVTSIAFGQTRSLNRFINKNKTSDNALAITVPGWLFDAASFSAKYIDDNESKDEIKDILKIAKKIKRIRLLVVNNEEGGFNPKHVQKLRKGLKRERFEELLTVHSEDADVQFMIKEKRNSIRNVTAFIKVEDTVVLLTLSGKFKYSDFKKMKIWDDIKDEINGKKDKEEEERIIRKV